MMLLGDILASAKRSASAFEDWAQTADPDLAKIMKTEAQVHGMTSTGYLRMAVSDFSRFADENDWAQLSRVVRDDGDPAIACLKAMLNWRMTASACKDHSLRIEHEHSSPLQSGSRS